MDEIDVEDTLWNAATEGRLEDTLRFLARLGGKTDHADEHGFTALMAAVQYGHVGVARELLARGADPNLRDVEGNTSLHHCETAECVALLALTGIEVGVKNVDGLTALATRRAELDEARQNGDDSDDEDVVALVALVAALERLEQEAAANKKRRTE